MATKKGRGLLMVYVDVPAPLEDEFNRWYNEEHIPERLAIPGVLNAARYAAVRGGPQYLACYELEEPEAYFSALWQQRLAHPTPWTQRITIRNAFQAKNAGTDMPASGVWYDENCSRTFRCRCRG